MLFQEFSFAARFFWCPMMSWCELVIRPDILGENYKETEPFKEVMQRTYCGTWGFCRKYAWYQSPFSEIFSQEFGRFSWGVAMVMLSAYINILDVVIGRLTSKNASTDPWETGALICWVNHILRFAIWMFFKRYVIALHPTIFILNSLGDQWVGSIQIFLISAVVVFALLNSFGRFLDGKMRE